METLDPRSWHGRFVPQCDENGTDCCLLGEDGLLCAPLLVDGLSVYRLHAAFRNVDGNGRLCLDIHVDDGNPFPQSVLRCPADPDSWQMFEVDLATARCPSGTSALLRIGRTANGTGTILVGRLAFRKLPRGSNQNAVPRLLGCEGILSHGIGRHEYLDAGQYTVVMEASMNELEQQSWRGRGIVAKRDERGVKCQSMEGEKSIIFVPMKVEPNTVYRLHLDLRRETGNGKLFCNLYASRSFDFPHVGLTCETGGWGIFDVQVRTGSFPANLPIVLRLWRAPGGTGSLLVRRIAIERLPDGAAAESPRMIASSAAERMIALQATSVAAPQGPARAPAAAPAMGHGNRMWQPKRLAEAVLPPSGLAHSRFERQPTRVCFASELGDEAAMRAAFEANGLWCEALPLAGDISRLPELVRSRGGNWIHFHLRGDTAMTAAIVDKIRETRGGTIVTAWVEPHWPVFDNRLLPMLRGLDVALVESGVELASYRAAGCFNAELWDPGADPPIQMGDKTGCDVAVLPDDRSMVGDGLAEACVRLLGAQAIMAGKGDIAILAEAKVSVFAGQWPTRDLFRLLAAGKAVLARRSVETMGWCEDGRSLRLFDTPEECVALAAQLLADPVAARILGENGMLAAAAHSRTKRVRELAVRLGCFEVVVADLQGNRTLPPPQRVLCVMRAPPVDLMALRSVSDIGFAAAPFTECRDLAARIARFEPDLLHVHLDADEDNLPWRDLLLDLRRRIPRMLVTAWHPGGLGVDRRMVDLRFSVDHLLVGKAGSLPQYHAMSLVGTEAWEPGVSPAGNPAAFREAVCALARDMGSRRRRLLAAADGGTVDLTVSIGTFNRLGQLRRAVETALASVGARPAEIVVNDAGSTDGTQDWLRRMAAADSRVVPLLSGRRTSFTQAFNENLQIAKGKYICWLSDDIVSEGSALADMCAIMDGLTPMDMGGFCVRNSWNQDYVVRKDAGFYLPTVGCMYTETMRKLNGINMDYPYYSQDTELDVRVLKLGGRIVACEKCRLLHDCQNDALRVGNYHSHIGAMGDAKYVLTAWRLGEASCLPYPRILLLPVGGGPAEIIRTAMGVRSQYSNSHLFVGGEAAVELDTGGPNSFLRKIPTMDGRALHMFDIVVEVGSGASTLVRPANKAQTPFARKMLQR